MFYMENTTIHVIDFEGSRASGIIEYGVVTLLGQSIESTVTRICSPSGPLSDKDTSTHGISEERASIELSFEREWEHFARLRQTGPLCAHNASVEDALLRSLWSYPRQSPDFTEATNSVTSWGPWLDTLHIYRQLYPQLESYKLQDLIDLFDLKPELEDKAKLYCPVNRIGFHCALYDALACALLLLHLFSHPELKEINIPWLLLQSTASAEKRANFLQQELL